MTAQLLMCGDVNLATNTVGHINDYDQGGVCTGFDSAGPDVVFKIVLGSGATVDLTFDGPYDASVYLIRNCGDPAGTCVAGSDTYPPGLPDNILYTNPTGSDETLYLIIDGYGPDVTTANMGPGVLTGTIGCGGVPPVVGACCNRATGGCSEISNLLCASEDGIFQGAGSVCSPTPCPPAESRCRLPGLSVTHDVLGDYADPPVGSAQQDVERVQIAEPWIGGSRQLAITLKVDSLATTATGLPVNALWTVYFSVAGDIWARRFVQMTMCDPLELPGFAYGHTEPSPTGGQLNLGDGATTGTWSGDGTIRITIDPALVGNPAVGTNLTNVHGETTVFQPGAACTGFISTIDDSPFGTYAVKGNDYCKPFTVTCPANFGGSANDGVITKTFTITNPSTAQRRFQGFISDANIWIVGGSVTGSVDLMPNTSGTIQASLQMPSNCAPSTTDGITFTASASDLPVPDNVKQCSLTAMCTQTVGVGDEVRSLSFSLDKNPIRGEGMLSYSLSERRPVRIEVFGVSGQRLQTLVNREDGPGNYSVPFRVHTGGSRLGAGIYLVRITAGNERRSLRVVALD